MIISMIAAMDKNRIIGAENDMPWHLPDDLKFFKSKTQGKTVVMGRKTFESIGSRPLPNRRNLVVTRNDAFRADGVEIFHSIESAISSSAEETEIVIMGGGQLYKQCMPWAQKLYITQIDAVVDGDTVFPEWDDTQWKEIDRVAHAKDEKHAYAFEFVTLIN